MRLRSNLCIDEAKPFCERNPRISRALTSRYAPAIGASLAGFALGICPQDQIRLTATIYTITRSMEFLYNVMDLKGWLNERPWWFGSWLLMPVSCAQLFHAFLFDRETTPTVCRSRRTNDIRGSNINLVVWQYPLEALPELYPQSAGFAPRQHPLAGEGRNRGFSCIHCEPALAVSTRNQFHFFFLICGLTHAR